MCTQDQNKKPVLWDCPLPKKAGHSHIGAAFENNKMLDQSWSSQNSVLFLPEPPDKISPQEIE